MEFWFEQVDAETVEHILAQADQIPGDFPQRDPFAIESVIDSLSSQIAKVAPADKPKDHAFDVLARVKKEVGSLQRYLRDRRFARIALIGRRGVGKSSLINAILGQKIAAPGHIRAQTGKAKILIYRLPDGSGIDVLDTRGLNEGGKPEEDDDAQDAVSSIVNALSLVPVDCILFLHKAKERNLPFHSSIVDSGLQADLQKLEEVLKQSNLIDGGIPIIGVITHVDEAKEFFQQQISKLSPSIISNVVGVEAVSSSVIWESEPNDKNQILPKRDYRYNIDKLMDLLIKNLTIQAVFEVPRHELTRQTVRVCRIQKVKLQLGEKLVQAFASVASAIGMLPIPADPLSTSAIQIAMVYTITKLSGKDVSITSVFHFFHFVGVNGLLRYALRMFSGTMVKYVPLVGFGASAAITYALTVALGRSALAFYIENKSADEVRKLFEDAKREVQENEALARAEWESAHGESIEMQEMSSC